jgi:hypothetical protein
MVYRKSQQPDDRGRPDPDPGVKPTEGQINLARVGEIVLSYWPIMTRDTSTPVTKCVNGNHSSLFTYIQVLHKIFFWSAIAWSHIQKGILGKIILF